MSYLINNEEEDLEKIESIKDYWKHRVNNIPVSSDMYDFLVSICKELTEKYAGRWFVERGLCSRALRRKKNMELLKDMIYGTRLVSSYADKIIVTEDMIRGMIYYMQNTLQWSVPPQDYVPSKSPKLQEGQEERDNQKLEQYMNNVRTSNVIYNRLRKA